MLLTLVMTAATAQSNHTAKARPAGKPAAQVQKKGTAAKTNAKPVAKTKAAAAMQNAMKPQPYTILGKAINIKDGQKVYLATIENHRQKRVDSATVRNGAFTFKGKTPPVPLSRFLVTGMGYNTVNADFFLEPGTIRASLTGGKRADHITGTRHNNIYVHYKDTSNLIVSQMVEQYTLMGSSSSTPDQKNAGRLRGDSLKQRYTEYACEFTRRNTDNMVGIFLLSEYYRQFPIDDLKVILNRMKKYKSLALIKTVQKYYDNAVKTQPGHMLVDLDMLTLEDEASKLSQTAGQGQPLLLYLWSGSIPASSSEVIPLKRLKRNYGQRGVQFASLCLDADTAIINKSLRRTNPDWPQFKVAEGQQQHVMNAYNLSELPYIILFDAQGRIAARGLRRNALEEKLKTLISQTNETD